MLDAAVSAALHRGDVLPRYHAATRPTDAEAVATARALAFAAAPTHRSTSSTSRGRGLDEVRGRRRAGVRVHGRDLPPLPDPDGRALRRARSGHAAPATSSRLPCVTGRSRRAVGGTRGRTLDLVATDHVADRVDEKAAAANGVAFNEISNGAPGIETLLSIVSAKESPRDASPMSGWSTCWRQPLPGGSASDEGRTRGRARRGPRPVRPGRPPDDPRRRPPPHQRLHPIRRTRDLGGGPDRIRSWTPGHPRRQISSAVGAPGPSSSAAQSAPDNERSEQSCTVQALLILLARLIDPGRLVPRDAAGPDLGHESVEERHEAVGDDPVADGPGPANARRTGPVSTIASVGHSTTKMLPGPSTNREPTTAPERIGFRIGVVEELDTGLALLVADAHGLVEAQQRNAEEDLQRRPVAFDRRRRDVVDPVVPGVPVDELLRRDKIESTEARPDVGPAPSRPQVAPSIGEPSVPSSPINVSRRPGTSVTGSTPRGGIGTGMGITANWVPSPASPFPARQAVKEQSCIVQAPLIMLARLGFFVDSSVSPRRATRRGRPRAVSASESRSARPCPRCSSCQSRVKPL